MTDCIPCEPTLLGIRIVFETPEEAASLVLGCPSNPEAPRHVYLSECNLPAQRGSLRAARRRNPPWVNTQHLAIANSRKKLAVIEVPAKGRRSKQRAS